MAYPSWGRGQGDFPQTILETSEKVQSPERQAPVRVRLAFAFPAVLGSSRWCQVVFGQGPESSSGSRPWMLRSACVSLQGVEEPEAEPGPLGARN